VFHRLSARDQPWGTEGQTRRAPRMRIIGAPTWRWTTWRDGWIPSSPGRSTTGAGSTGRRCTPPAARDAYLRRWAGRNYKRLRSNKR